EPRHDLIESPAVLFLAQLESGVGGTYVGTKRDDVLAQLLIPVAHLLHLPGVSPIALEMAGEAANGGIGLIGHELHRDLEAGPSPASRPAAGKYSLRALEKESSPEARAETPPPADCSA